MRYALCQIVSFYHMFTEDFLSRLVKRIVSAPAPLMPTPNNAFTSTIENVSGSDAGAETIR